MNQLYPVQIATPGWDIILTYIPPGAKKPEPRPDPRLPSLPVASPPPAKLPEVSHTRPLATASWNGPVTIHSSQTASSSSESPSNGPMAQPLITDSQDLPNLNSPDVSDSPVHKTRQQWERKNRIQYLLDNKTFPAEIKIITDNPEVACEFLDGFLMPASRMLQAAKDGVIEIIPNSSTEFPISIQYLKSIAKFSDLLEENLVYKVVDPVQNNRQALSHL